MRFKHILLAMLTTLLVATALAAHAQVQLSLWNFNDENFNVDGGVLGGSLTLLGGVTHEWVTGSPLDTASPNRGMNTRNYPAQGTGNRTAGVRFNTPTTGYMNVVVKLDFRWSNTASKYARFQYTVDGANWIDGPQLVATGGDTWYSQGYGGLLVVDFTGNSAVSNNPLFAFRVVSEFAPGTNQYQAARATSSYASTGTYRFDLVEVQAVPVPEPASLASVAAGLAGLFALRRRNLR
ncbi:MAG: PEP-CTERM sorting domain-containing protein [bacterium]|nr:PEP-CTERM sorting domain-containing protein [bacterium]